MIVIQNYSHHLKYTLAIIVNLLVHVSSSQANGPTTGRQNATSHSNKADQQSVTEILKDTLQLLDVLDKELVQASNRTQIATMRDNLRLLGESPAMLSASNEDEELVRLADTFTSERKRASQQVQAEIMSAQASQEAAQYKPSSTLEPVHEAAELTNWPSVQVHSVRKLRQLNSQQQQQLTNFTSSMSHLDNDFTDRHIQFSLDLMQAMFSAQDSGASVAQRAKQLESFLISPVSIQMVLMMMHLGARGQTKRELANCLRLPQDRAPQSPALASSAGEQSANKLKRRTAHAGASGPKRATVSASGSASLTATTQSANNAHELFGSAMRNLLKDTSVVKALSSANQIYVQRDLILAAQYEQAVRRFYNAELRHVDFQQQQSPLNSSSLVNASNHALDNNNNNNLHFQQQQQSVQNIINEWVERQTKGKISNFLAAPVPTSTVLMAINVLFFKGDWQYKFDPADTDPEAWFTLADGRTVKLAMMVNRLPLAHAYDATMKTSLIELPYKAQRLGLFMLLPDEVDGIFNTMRQLNSTTFANLISMMRKSAPNNDGNAGATSSLQSSGINVRIPKFNIESSPRLSYILSQQLGLKTLFAPDQADLSGMFGRAPMGFGSNATRHRADNSTSLPQVGLDELVHKAVLQVHEHGSIAAAASATIVERVGSFNGQYFEADHPFLLFLMDKQTGLVLFSGLFAGPSNSANPGMTP